MIEYFDIDNLNKGAYCVGKVNQKVINLLNLDINEVDIIFSKDKIEYTVKHKDEYKTYDDYKRFTELTPNIISSPDYISMHPSGKSIEYIKIIDEIMIVAVRIKPHGVLWVKTVFPITIDKFKTYEKSGTLIKYE
ncbi:MAG TPA: hypothetical protein VEB00_05590 [Clostridia bacterium]|nr:hypothetical protein [Clostridia bacterium]